MQLSEKEQNIKDKALVYAKKNKKVIARRLTSVEFYLPEENPVSVFMAGSPGAGKTEASKALMEKIDGDVLRIDPDELRLEFDEYDGSNSWLFQPAVSILVEKLHDFVLKQKQSFLLDGTLSNYDIAEKNISRSLSKNRFVQILYVYQQPESAWSFVLKREKVEGRRILPQHFIEQYFAARKVVNQLKRQFGKDIQVDLLLKENDGSNRLYKAGIDCIDNHVIEKYTREEIEQILDVSPTKI